MKQFKGAIFDLDGTLVDSMHMWENVTADYLAGVGITPGGEVLERVRAMSIQQACAYFCDVCGLRLTPDEIAAGVNRMMEDFYFNKVSLKAGVRDTLERLRRRGVKMCVATATDRYLAEGGLRHAGILPFFDGIVTCTEAGAGKDEPDIYLKALSLLGTDLDDTVVFEDALYAVRTAKAAGFTVIALHDAAADHQREEIIRLTDRYFMSFEDWTRENAAADV